MDNNSKDAFKHLKFWWTEVENRDLSVVIDIDVASNNLLATHKIVWSHGEVLLSTAV